MADYLLIAGLVACQGLLICDTLTYQMNAMDDFALASTSIPVKKVRAKATEKLHDLDIKLLLIHQ